MSERPWFVLTTFLPSDGSLREFSAHEGHFHVKRRTGCPSRSGKHACRGGLIERTAAFPVRGPEGYCSQHVLLPDLRDRSCDNSRQSVQRARKRRMGNAKTRFAAESESVP